MNFNAKNKVGGVSDEVFKVASKEQLYPQLKTIETLMF